MVEYVETYEAIPDQSVGFDFEQLYGIDDATVVFHVSKSQISRDSNSKRLPYILNDRKKKRYKATDLYQIYGFRKQGKREELKKKERSEQYETTGTEGKLLVELAILKEQLRSKEEAIQAKNEALRRSDDEIRDLRQTRDRLIEQNNKLTLLLPAPSDSNEQEKNFLTSTQHKPRLSFWQRIFQ